MDTPTREALQFVREMANDELARIERMHQRTLRSIGYVLAALGLIGAFVGWIGFQNLKEAAIATATINMQAEVKKSVESGLKNLDVPNTIKRNVDSYAQNELRQQIAKELRSGPLHNDVVAAGREESAKLTKTLFIQRVFSVEQKHRLTSAIDEDDSLAGARYQFYAAEGSIEVSAFASPIFEALDDSQLKQYQTLTRAKDPGRIGVAIYCNISADCEQANHIAAAFLKAGIKAPVIPAEYSSPINIANEPPFTIIWVGPAYQR